MPDILTPVERLDFRNMLCAAINNTIPDILREKIYEPYQKHTTGGYIVNPDFVTKCNDLFKHNLKKEADHKGFPLEEKVNVLCEERFEHNFERDRRAALIANVPDGKKSLVRHLATLTRRLAEHPIDGENVVLDMPDSAISAALFEGYLYDDITVSAVGRIHKAPELDQFSAFKANDGLYLAFSRDRFIQHDPAWDKIPMQQAKVLMITSTNKNSEGIGEIRDYLQLLGVIDEARFECKGSSANDFFPVYDEQWNALVDPRAEFEGSWATLRLRNAAYMVPLAKALDMKISNVHGSPLDSYVRGPVLDNRELSLILSTNKRLHKWLHREIGEVLDDAKEKWNIRRTTKYYQPQHPKYDLIKSMISTPFKISYLAKHKKNGKRRFIHILELNEDGTAYCDSQNLTLEDVIRNECMIDSEIDLDHENILKPEKIETYKGKVFIIEPCYSKTLDEIYIPNEAIKEENYSDFYSHAEQILSGMAAAHRYEKDGELHPIIHGDLKLSNIGLSGSTIKIDDWGISSILKTVNLTDLRTRSVGTINARAPEQFRKKVKNTQSDVFAIGTVLFRMLTGYYPTPKYDKKKPRLRSAERIEFEDSVDKFRNSNKFPAYVKESLSHVPEDLALFIERLLSQDPNERPKDAYEALEEFKVVRRRYQAYMTSRSYVESMNSETDMDRYQKIHLLDTEKRVHEKLPGASYALRTGAIMHDWNESYTSGELKWFDRIKKQNAKKCADSVGNFLNEATRADKDFIDAVTKYVRFHENKKVPRNVKQDIKFLIESDTESFLMKVFSLYDQGIQDKPRATKAVSYMLDKVSPDCQQKIIRDNDTYLRIIDYLEDKFRKPEKS